MFSKDGVKLWIASHSLELYLRAWLSDRDLISFNFSPTLVQYNVVLIIHDKYEGII